MGEKRLVGSVYGSGNPLDDIANLVALYQKGRLKLGELATRTYPLDGVNDAFGALAAGAGGRGIIRPSSLRVEGSGSDQSRARVRLGDAAEPRPG